MPTVQDATSNTKLAIVTGGSRGLGRNTVLSLANRGVQGNLHYNSNRVEAEKVVGSAEQGLNSEALVQEAIERFIDYDEWFIREVEKGLASADRAELLTLGGLLNYYYRKAA